MKKRLLLAIHRLTTVSMCILEDLALPESTSRSGHLHQGESDVLSRQPKLNKRIELIQFQLLVLKLVNYVIGQVVNHPRLDTRIAPTGGVVRGPGISSLAKTGAGF